MQGNEKYFEKSDYYYIFERVYWKDRPDLPRTFILPMSEFAAHTPIPIVRVDMEEELKEYFNAELAREMDEGNFVTVDELPRKISSLGVEPMEGLWGNPIEEVGLQAIEGK
jgi:hypothetical protein